MNFEVVTVADVVIPARRHFRDALNFTLLEVVALRFDSTQKRRLNVGSAVGVFCDDVKVSTRDIFTTIRQADRKTGDCWGTFVYMSERGTELMVKTKRFCIICVGVLMIVGIVDAGQVAIGQSRVAVATPAQKIRDLTNEQTALAGENSLLQIFLDKMRRAKGQGGIYIIMDGTTLGVRDKQEFADALAERIINGKITEQAAAEYAARIGQTQRALLTNFEKQIAENRARIAKIRDEIAFLRRKPVLPGTRRPGGGTVTTTNPPPPNRSRGATLVLVGEPVEDRTGTLGKQYWGAFSDGECRLTQPPHDEVIYKVTMPKSIPQDGAPATISVTAKIDNLKKGNAQGRNLLGIIKISGEVYAFDATGKDRVSEAVAKAYIAISLPTNQGESTDEKTFLLKPPNTDDPRGKTVRITVGMGFDGVVVHYTYRFE